MKTLIMCAAVAAALLASAASRAETFTYHGSLQDAGKAAEGAYDLQLTLYSSERGGTPVAGPVSIYNVAVHDGSFSTDVDFGQTVLNPSASWVGVAVRPTLGGDFVALDTRSAVTPDGGCIGTWNLDGNSGIPNGSYIGTSDDTTLVFRTNGQRQGVFNVGGGLALGDGTNAARGLHSFAGGTGNVLIGHDYSFVWSGASTGPGFSSSGAGQFLVKAPGGVAINTAGAETGGLQAELTIASTSSSQPSDLIMINGNSGSGTLKGYDLTAQSDGTFGIFRVNYDGTNPGFTQLLRINYVPVFNVGNFDFNGSNGGHPITVGTGTLNGNGAYLSDTGVWTNASSRTWKENFAHVDVEAVLGKLIAMPVQSWFYKGNHADGLHIGPVAEDFASLFGLGSNEKYIGTVDESGVALAAIQGLNKKLETENADLRTRLDAVIARLDRIEKTGGR